MTPNGHEIKIFDLDGLWGDVGGAPCILVGTWSRAKHGRVRAATAGLNVGRLL